LISIFIEGRTMRTKWWVGLVTIAVAAPFGAQAGNQATVSDFWDSIQVQKWPEISPRHVALESQSDPAAAVVREPTAIRAVDTYMGRRFEASSTIGGGRYVAAPPRVVPTTTVVSTTTPHQTAAPTAAPEMNPGLAAAGLTLLFGGVAILRGRRSRSNV
jgi:hypothetical protein